jgi:tetratricopeptide (TPR) repeat protein
MMAVVLVRVAAAERIPTARMFSFDHELARILCTNATARWPMSFDRVAGGTGAHLRSWRSHALMGFDRVAEGDGTVAVLWQMPIGVQPLCVEMQSHSEGTQRWERTTMTVTRVKSRDQTVPPGVSERVRFVYVFPEYTTSSVTTNIVGSRTTITSSSKETDRTFTARVEIVRAPLPPALTAVAGDGQVRVQWPRLAYDAADWIEGPWLLLRRYTPDGVAVKDQKFQIQQAKEIFRGAGTATEFTDHAVTNGATYFYTLDIEGVTSATSWSQADGPFKSVVPVTVRGEVALAQSPVAATPQPSHELRLAVVNDPIPWPYDPRANLLYAHCLRALHRTPWIKVLDRSVAPVVSNEIQVRKLQGADQPPRHTADAILHWRQRQLGYERRFDVWLEDFQNQQKERLLSEPLEPFDVEQTSRQLLAALAKRYPAAVKQIAPVVDVRIRTLAVTRFQRLSENTLPPAAFDDLLVAALGRDTSLKLVERDKPGAALPPSKLLPADAILSGFYLLTATNITLSARLLDAGTGALLNVCELTGLHTELDSLARRLAERVSVAARQPQPGTDSPWQRWMEAKSYAQNPFAAAVTSPETPDYHYKIGREQQARGALKEALGHYRNGLELAEKTEDPWRFYVAMGDVLTTLRRSEERHELWQRAVADRNRRGADQTEALGNLSRSLRLLRRPDEAVAALDRIPRDKCNYDTGREYEICGRTNDAIAVYGTIAWQGFHPFRNRTRQLGPGYAALVRLAGSSASNTRITALKAIVTKVGADRPQQLEKALHELQQLGVDLKGLIPAPRSPATPVMPFGRPPGPRIGAGPRSFNPASTSPAAPATPMRRNLITHLGDDQLLVDGNAVVSRVATSGDVLWQFDPHARPPSRTNSTLYGTGSSILWYNSSFTIDHFISDLQLLAQAMLLDGDTLYAPNPLDGTLTALDARNGQPQWTFVNWVPITRPVLLRGELWVGDSLGHAYQLSRTDGKVIGRHRYTEDFIERVYGEQLLQLNADDTRCRLSFINPHLTGEYRLADGLQTLEFESHHFQLDGPTLSISTFSSEPYRTLPENAQIDGSIVRLGAAQLGKDPAATIISIYDKDSSSRAAAVAKARFLPEREQAVPVLLELLDDASEDAALRAEAVAALSEICGSAFLPRLVTLTEDNNPLLRRAAARGLGRLGNRAHDGLLQRLLRDRDADTRNEAVGALVRVHGGDARAALADLLQIRGSPLRARLLFELVKAGDRDAIPLLKEAVPDESYVKDDDVLVTLCRANDPTGEAELQRRFDFERGTTEPIAAALLVGARLPETRYGDLLRSVFRTGDRWGVQPALAPGLAALGDPHSIPALISALPGRSPENMLIIMALEDLTGQSFGDNTARWEYWWKAAAPSELKTQATAPSVPQLKPAPTTSIHTAVTAGDIDRIKQLLSQDPSVLESTADRGGAGLTPLQTACLKDNVDVVRLLLDHGANIEAHWWINNATPLLLALHSKCSQVAMFLVSKGANVKARDKMGRTTLKYATEQKNDELIKLLRAHGAIE